MMTDRIQQLYTFRFYSGTRCPRLRCRAGDLLSLSLSLSLSGRSSRFSLVALRTGKVLACYQSRTSPVSRRAKGNRARGEHFASFQIAPVLCVSPFSSLFPSLFVCFACRCSGLVMDRGKSLKRRSDGATANGVKENGNQPEQIAKGKQVLQCLSLSSTHPLEQERERIIQFPDYDNAI